MTETLDLCALEALHKKSLGNGPALSASGFCLCFYCQKVIPTNSVVSFVNDRGLPPTALCPLCDVDSVLAGVDLLACGFSQDVWLDISRQMHAYFFRRRRDDPAPVS